MEQFEIELVGVIFGIHPQNSGNFKIYDGTKCLGEIKPVPRADTSIEWTTADLMEIDFANQSGS